MEVIADELQKTVDIGMTALLQHINYILGRHEKLYEEMAEHLGPGELLSVFAEMNVNSLGRAMAYFTLVYLMNIPEDVKHKAVRLVAPVLRNVDATRVEGFFQRMFSWIRCVLALWTMRIGTMWV